MTFSDSTGHNVGVTITNGLPASSTVDLSGLTDGTITATLHLNNDAAGNSFTNVVTTATLDRDTALKLTVNGGAPIGAATAAATPFTVAGIESDDNGTVSFSDGTHTPVVVNIVNGVVAATAVNLAGLTDGTITATLHLNSDAAGNPFTNVVTTATLDQDSGEQRQRPPSRLVAEVAANPRVLLQNMPPFLLPIGAYSTFSQAGAVNGDPLRIIILIIGKQFGGRPARPS